MRFATLLFGKILLSSHPNLLLRSERYQRLFKQLILISALLLSMLIWLIETEFMGFFLKYVIVSYENYCIFTANRLIGQLSSGHNLYTKFQAC